MYNTLQKSDGTRTKNTGCSMNITIKLAKASDECLISLSWNHNHPVASLQALTFKDISPETASEIKNLFDQGYSPGETPI